MNQKVGLTPAQMATTSAARAKNSTQVHEAMGVLKHLCVAGADISGCLVYAHSADVEVVRFLLEQKADPSETDADGFRAVDLATDADGAVVSILLAAGSPAPRARAVHAVAGRNSLAIDPAPDIPAPAPAAPAPTAPAPAAPPPVIPAPPNGDPNGFQLPGQLPPINQTESGSGKTFDPLIPHYMQ